MKRILIFITLLTLSCPPLLAQENLSQPETREGDEKEEAVETGVVQEETEKIRELLRVDKIKGAAQVQKKGQEMWQEVTPATTLTDGD